MIRASIQLSPKSKVVDFLVLYNFYFGQISCSNVKFGALDGQSQLKTTQVRSTVPPLFSLSSPPASTSEPSTRRADEPRPSSLHARPYPHGAVSVFPFLSPPSRSTDPSNPSCTPLAAPVPIPATSRRRASIPRVASRATSPYTFFAPSRARLSPPPAGIEVADRGRH